MPWDTIFVLAIVVVVTLVGARNYRNPQPSRASSLYSACEDEELFRKCVDELPPVYESYPVQPPVVRFEKYDPNLRSDVLDLSCDDCGMEIVEGEATVTNSEWCLAHRTCPDVYEVLTGDGVVIRRFPYSRCPPPDTSWVTTEIVRW